MSSMTGPGSLLPDMSKRFQNNPLLNPAALLPSKKLRQASVDPLNLYGGNTPPLPGVDPAPVVPQPAPMPEVGDQQFAAARRKSLEAQASRRGRVATILSDSGTSERLGS